MAGFSAALLPPEHGGPDAAATAAAMRRYLGHLPRPVRAGVRAAFATVDGLARATAGGRLADLDPDARVRFLRALAGRPSTEPMVTGLKALVLLVSGAEAAAGEILAAAAGTGPARPDGALAVTDAADWPSLTRCDAVVVGSGAGGAMAARTLARAGLDVVVVEEGRRFTVEEFRTAPPLDRFASLYRDGGTTMALGRPPVMLPIGRGVGGTTLVNSGTCYRTPAAVLAHWHDDHGFTLAAPERFGPWLDEVEATLQVAPVPAGVMGRNGALLLEGAAALGWRAGPLHRNAPGCGGCCQCAIGCPRNAKFGVHLNALPQACAAGARILARARVARLVHDGRRAHGVVAVRPDGSRLEVRAPVVVVAAGATETPPLLRRSGLGRHPCLGRNLSLHPALSAAGRFAEEVVPWHGVLQSAAVEEFHERQGILVEATSTPPGMGSMVLPGLGRDLLAELDGARHLVTLGAMIADAPSGRVLGGRRAVLRYDLTRDDGRRLLRAVRIMAEALFAAGATEVLPGLPGTSRVGTLAALDEALERARPRQLHLAAFHPTGTAAAGGDDQRHPVDPEGRLRGIAGVWVADAAVLPSCPTVNPQVSVMAAALAVSEALLIDQSVKSG